MQKHHILSLATLTLVFAFSCQEPVLNTQPEDLSGASATPAPSSSPASAPPEAPAAATGGRLQGVIQEQGSRRPLEGVEVRLNDKSQTTDASGFYLFDDVPEGASKLLVNAEGFLPVNRTVNLTNRARVEDIFLEPENRGAVADPPTVILLPDGSTATAEPTPAASAMPEPAPTVSATPDPAPAASATPVPTATPSSTPEPEPTPAYDPALDEVAQAEVAIQRRNNGLSLTPLLQRSNGLPVTWQRGQVFLEYFIADTEDNLLTSGRSFVESSDERLTLSLGSRSAGEEVKVDITLILPNSRTVKVQSTVTVQG